MSFSCGIYVNGKDITEGDDPLVNYGLFGLAPSNSDATDAHYRLDAIRKELCNHPYKETHRFSAIDCFEKIQWMAKANLDSLITDHCETCKCGPIKSGHRYYL